jgi:hypothetical protein
MTIFGRTLSSFQPSFSSQYCTEIPKLYDGRDTPCAAVQKKRWCGQR